MERTLRALDLCCGAGGAARGLMDAGYEVTGFDNRPQPHYPGDFHRMDISILEPEDVADYDLVWASVPCERFSRATPVSHQGNHPDLIPFVRNLVQTAGVPAILENVPQAPLRPDVTLCGAMFANLPNLVRHRIFELIGLVAPQPRHRPHPALVFSVYGHTGGTLRGGKPAGTLEDWQRAMGISWMNARELSDAIPPAYAYYLATSAVRVNPAQAAAARVESYTLA